MPLLLHCPALPLPRPSLPTSPPSPSPRRCTALPGREATPAELLAVHSEGLVSAVEALSSSTEPALLAYSQKFLGPDLLGSRGTAGAARVAAGIAAELAARVARGEADGAFGVIRPPGEAGRAARVWCGGCVRGRCSRALAGARGAALPALRPALRPRLALTLPPAPLARAGHNAKRDLASGGCYFNNAAVAARAAQAAGAKRVMVVDWDVHHCAGTQAIFQDDPSVLLVSMHWLEQ
jgi:acetoin utilization deacetylase AcuC-like enzyme